MPETGAVDFGGLPCPRLPAPVRGSSFPSFGLSRAARCSKRTVGQISGRPSAPVGELQTAETSAAGVRTSACLSSGAQYKPMSNVTNEQTRAVHDNQTKAVPFVIAARTSQMENRQTGGLQVARPSAGMDRWTVVGEDTAKKRAARKEGSGFTDNLSENGYDVGGRGKRERRG
jgi:hypothetical protein